MRTTAIAAAVAFALMGCQQTPTTLDALSDEARPLSTSTVSELDETVDIDANGDCEIEGVFEELEGANVHVTINGNWIIATCHVQLEEEHLVALGGPFSTAQVYRDFECLVGNDDDLEDIEATMSHAVITPTGLMNIMCKAPLPDEPMPE